MGLRSFIAKRLVYSAILVIAVIGLNFLLFMMMPGDPTDFLMQGFSRESGEDREAHLARLKELWGIGEPWHIQFFKYMRNLLSFNLGTELVGRKPISAVMTQKIPYTLFILGGSTIFSIVIGIVLGIWAIQRRGGVFDTSSVLFSLIVNSLPTFWIGLIFLWLFTNTLGWLPGARAFPMEWAAGNWPTVVTSSVVSGSSVMGFSIQLNPTELWKLLYGFGAHAILPIATLTVFFFGGWLLLTRATMLDVITEDYIVTARAKGLSEQAVLYKHAFRNASLPIITSAALAFGFILSGAIITETVFSYPGLGGWIWNSIQYRDYSVLMSVFYIISICVIIANIISDLLYGIIDPRIKYG
ncbi:ABC transporter permease [Candidatus Bathyarchaeota archaeon]|nr:ABC transporter permease [Candidatus Bathyarchaeota archaeon]